MTDLAYDDMGVGDPVVLLHGGLLGRAQWDAEFPALAAHHRVVRVDLRGHGGSPAPAGDFANHADLIAVLDHLGIESVTAVGLSLGARTIIDAAILHPHRFKAAVLASPGYSGIEFTDPYILARNAEMAAAVAAKDADAFVEAFLRAWVDGPRRQPDQVDPDERQRCHDMALIAATKGAGSTGTLLEVGAADRLGELTMPVDVVLGDLDSADIEQAAEKIAGAAPNARLHRITGAGHTANLDQPVAFAHVLRYALQRSSSSSA